MRLGNQSGKALCLLIAVLAPAGLPAQVVDARWTAPKRLSSLQANIVDRALALDSFGYAHAFWIEHLAAESRYTLKYVRFDGEQWSPAIVLEDIPNIWAGYMTALDANIDSRGRIHLLWGGNWGPVHHRIADVRFTLSQDFWSSGKVYEVNAHVKRMFVDAEGTYHLVYAPFFGAEPRGVFYQRSRDEGATWSAPVNIHPQLGQGLTAQTLDVQFDGRAGLHAVWTEVDMATFSIKSVRYTRSGDLGESWAAPILMDEASAQNPDVMRACIPLVAAANSGVVVIWGGGGVSNVGRRYRFSTDNGRTWSNMEQLFGELHGQAGSDAARFDSEGRLHLLTQIRWPQGIYHAVWQNRAWSKPELIYKIATDDRDIIGDRVHAQYFRMSIATDGQIASIFESCGPGCRDTSTLPNNSVLFGSNTVAARSLPGFVSVSAAAFTAGAPLAPEAIASGFGAQLSSGIVAADGPPRLDLGGTGIEVIDSGGMTRPAPLFLASPNQINFLVPANTASGTAAVRVRGPNRLVAAGRIEIERVAPAVFAANARGTGPAAGAALRIAADGSRTRSPIADGVDLSAGSGAVYLELYGTGFRNYTSAVTATVDGQAVPVLAAAAQGEFPGLDQINIGPLPAMAGRGEVEIRFTVDGRKANPVTVLVK